MKVLFLDDNVNRIELAYDAFCEDDLTVVKRAVDAIAVLDVGIGTIEWDLVMLDHDLGGVENGFTAGDEPTGMDVVNWIVAYQPKIKRIVVHSWNPVSTYVVDKLWRAGYRATWKRFAIMQQRSIYD